MTTTNNLGPSTSWRLIHDGETVIILEEMTGYTSTMHQVFEGPTKQSCMIEIYRLGLEFPKTPTPQ